MSRSNHPHLPSPHIRGRGIRTAGACSRCSCLVLLAPHLAHLIHPIAPSRVRPVCPVGVAARLARDVVIRAATVQFVLQLAPYLVRAALGAGCRRIRLMVGWHLTGSIRPVMVAVVVSSARVYQCSAHLCFSSPIGRTVVTES